ncbi:MAG: hypothetical protein HKP61_05360 [Dactylosporangium sp.]|nr:hypothetical protein [Dactylosporangium sp.]NNJ60375.1 hypothetical protein [Dactylosporangium sp.]
MIEQDMACAVCTYALNAIDTDDGTLTFEHPVAPTDGDHDPVPVPTWHLPEVYRRCHLCSVNEPIWEYRTPEIEALAIGGTRPVAQTYSTQWHACLPCSRLIEAKDHLALTRRSIAVIGWHPTEPGARILAGIHRAIVLTRKPGRTLLTTGAWTPAPVKATSLPKVRDRLAGLLGGPVRLPAPLHRARGLVAEGLDQARLYWIDPQFTGLVAQVLTDLPDTAVTERIVPAGSGLLAWSAPVDHRHRLTAASWTATAEGWQVACYRSLGLDLPPADLEPVRHEIGWLVPVHVVRLRRKALVNGDDPLAALVASWLIIAQQLTRAEPATVDPPIRRAYARTHRPPPEVHLVRIKPGTPRPAPATAVSDRTPSGRAKPDHRFWVSGHERNQAYGPGRSLRRKIDIDPFLKGPEGAPIKASTTVRILGTSRRLPVERSGRPSIDDGSTD